MTTIYDILEELKINANSQYEKGKRFEYLIKCYLENEPIYKDRFSQVWLWQDWPNNSNQPDTGIDLVAQDNIYGGYCAIQCKFYNSNEHISKQDIDSFLATSGKEGFTGRILVSTTSKWSENAKESLNNQQILTQIININDLDNSSIDWSQYKANNPSVITTKPKKQLLPHQLEALRKVQQGFTTADRGKLIMACGTGKTFTSLKIAEELLPHNGWVLFMVPSIALLSQSLREWTQEKSFIMHCFPVCSDSSSGKTSNDDVITKTIELSVPATTDPHKLIERIHKYKQHNNTPQPLDNLGGGGETFTLINLN